MQNPATRPSNELNEFTQILRDNVATIVLLRDGSTDIVEFFPAQDEFCVDCFGSDSKRWNLDGTSITHSSYDIMEIV